MTDHLDLRDTDHVICTLRPSLSQVLILRLRTFIVASDRSGCGNFVCVFWYVSRHGRQSFGDYEQGRTYLALPGFLTTSASSRELLDLDQYKYYFSLTPLTYPYPL